MTEREKEFELEEKNFKIISSSFIYNYFLDMDRKYSPDYYLTTIMRFSILEKILSEYFFKFSKKKDYMIYPLLDFYSVNPSKKSLFISYLKYFIDIFDEQNPLFFYSELSKELLRILKNEDTSNMKFEENILKIEFLLAWHIENNFLPKNILENFGMICNDNIYLNKGITNYIYSVNSIHIMCKFLESLEKQNICINMKRNAELIDDYFCSEKVYYYYCDNKGIKKLRCGNFIKYLIEQLDNRVNKYKNSKVNVFEIENYILLSLFFINYSITNYPFYLNKEPEISEIFELLEKYKTFPCPISNYCNHVCENIVNENYFQGISFLNKLRQMYYIDLLDKNVTHINVSDFRYTLIINSNEWENRHNDGSDKYFDLLKFLSFLIEKPKKCPNKKLYLKEILIKILISIALNSNQKVDEDKFKSLYLHYWPNYKALDSSNNNINDIKDKDKIKSSLDKILKLLDIGFDQTINDFDKEINILADKIINLSQQENKNDNGTLFNDNYLLPIDSMRNYLKPEFSEIKKIYRGVNNEYHALDLYDIYINRFKYIVNTYFPYLLKDSDDPLIQNNLNIIRNNFFENFRLNILLIEEQNTINDLIENFQKKIFDIDINKIISNEEFNNFWSLFTDDKKYIIPKFILYLVPSYDNYSLNPFRILFENDTLNDYYAYLSEYIANNDYIYKNIVFMPFASTCDEDNNFQKEINNLKMTEIFNNNENEEPFNNIDLKTCYSFLKKPLDIYMGESNGIFNLNLFKISLNKDTISKVIWKNIDILDKNNDNSRVTKITMKCVDYMGLEKKENIEINIGNNNFHLKLFNLFFKNNIPFNYNMSSNNGWLETFLDDKYDTNINPDFLNFSKFLEKNKENKFYGENNMPQNDIETRYKNYKVKEILIESNSPSISIKCDDYEELTYDEKIDLTMDKKNNGELKLKIKIEAFKVNDENYRLPVATFINI